MDRPDFVIVQAGGRGSRLGHLTANKPKALVPVANLPVLFHLFRRYPSATFVVIADYQAEVMERYLRAFADVDYFVVRAEGTGTCAGIAEALQRVAADTPFLLTWCDLVLGGNDSWSDAPAQVGLSDGFECRWRYESGVFEEIPSATTGVAGVFAFQDKSLLEGVPSEGELVRWLSRSGIEFEPHVLTGAQEFGVLAHMDQAGAMRTRPFNRLEWDEDTITKYPIDEQGYALAKKEIGWYKAVQDLGFRHVPRIHSWEPLSMERMPAGAVIDGALQPEERSRFLDDLCDVLTELHHITEPEPWDADSARENYIDKTHERLAKVWQLAPFAQEKSIRINGRVCPNVWGNPEVIASLVESLPASSFRVIHGDPTFSNVLVSKERTPLLIDPRGYFGHRVLYGDPLYDWAKIYYSVVGNYDNFNRGKFSLHVVSDGVDVDIASAGWEQYGPQLMDRSGATLEQLEILHGLIWLSLTSYAWQDYDAVCASFYIGLSVMRDHL